MKTFAVMLWALFLTVMLEAKGCDDTLFSFDVSENEESVRIIDILENVAHECGFSVIINDSEAKALIKQRLFLVHIQDYTLENLFDFLFSRNNMFYRFDVQANLLTLSYLETRSFIIDYVNLDEQVTESTKTITVGTASNTQNSAYNGNSGYGSNTTGGSNAQQGGSNTDYTTVKSNTKFEFWEKLTNEIDAILSRDEDRFQIKSKSIINRDAGIVTITGTKSQIERVGSYLSRLRERLHKQVLLETKIFELRYKDSNSTGVDWSKFNLTLGGQVSNAVSGDKYSTVTMPSYTFNYNFSMDGLIDFLDRYGDVNVLSTPKILTLNNQPAVINVGNQINYRYESGSVSATNVGASTTNTYVMSSVFVGLTLNIVPEITDDGFIILRINPVVSEELDQDEALTSTTTTATTASDTVRTMPPDIKIKQLSSIVKAKDGARVLIGGLVSTRNYQQNTSVPLLGSIPVLGRLFSHSGIETDKVELIIVVTPKIIRHNEFPSIESAVKHLEGVL